MLHQGKNSPHDDGCHQQPGGEGEQHHQIGDTHQHRHHQTTDHFDLGHHRPGAVTAHIKQIAHPIAAGAGEAEAEDQRVDHRLQPRRGAGAVVAHCQRAQVHTQALQQFEQHSHTQQQQEKLVAGKGVERGRELGQRTQKPLAGPVDRLACRLGEQVYRQEHHPEGGPFGGSLEQVAEHAEAQHLPFLAGGLAD